MIAAPASGGRRAGGFTLVELLVALALLALLSAVAVPMLTGRPAGAELTASAEAIGHALGRTRGQALASNRPAIFEIDLSERWFRGGEDSRPGRIPPALAVSVTTARSETGPGERARFRFFPDGTASGGRILLTAATDRREIAIDWLTGRVRIGR